MPHSQLMTERANRALNRDMIGAAKDPAIRSKFEPGQPLDDALRALGVIDDGAGRPDGPELGGMIRILPTGIQDTIRNTVANAIDRSIPVQVVWLPGAGYEITVSEAVGVDASTTAISMVLRTPYPLPQAGPGSMPTARDTSPP